VLINQAPSEHVAICAEFEEIQVKATDLFPVLDDVAICALLPELYGYRCSQPVSLSVNWNTNSASLKVAQVVKALVRSSWTTFEAFGNVGGVGSNPAHDAPTFALCPCTS
jgi:hypothetical protein